MKKLIKMQANYEIIHKVIYQLDGYLSVSNYPSTNIIYCTGMIEGFPVIKDRYTVGVWKKKGVKIEKLNI